MKENKVISKKNRMDEEEGVEEYLNLLKETERLISMGEELIEQGERIRLWKNLNQLMLYPVISDEGNHLIYTDKNGMRYANLFTRPAYVNPRDEDYEIGGMLMDWLKDANDHGYSLLIHPSMSEYAGHGVLIDPKTTGRMKLVKADYSHKQKIYIIY